MEPTVKGDEEQFSVQNLCEKDHIMNQLEIKCARTLNEPTTTGELLSVENKVLETLRHYWRSFVSKFS